MLGSTRVPVTLLPDTKVFPTTSFAVRLDLGFSIFICTDRSTTIYAQDSPTESFGRLESIIESCGV